MGRLRNILLKKNGCPFGFCPNEGGGLPNFFVTYSRSAFLLDKGVSFFQNEL